MGTASSLRLIQHPTSLNDLSAWIEALATRHGLSARTVFSLDLVLTEAVTNIVDYADNPAGEGWIDLSCQVWEDRIEIELSDDGPAFDPTSRTPVQLPTSLADAKPGGLGIHLIRQYTTHMQYQRKNEHNVLLLSLPREHHAVFA